MTVKDIVTRVCRQNGITKAKLAKKLGMKNQAQIYNVLGRNRGMSMRVSTLVEWLDALDAQIIIQPAWSEQTFVLDNDAEDWEDDD